MTNNQLFFCGVLAIVSMCASCHTARYNESNWQERMIKNHHPYYFYNALYRDDVELVKRFLEAGSDPNYCKGENGWVDSNPLKVLAEGFHNTYNYRDQAPKANANQAPDVAILYLLIDSGADINKLPYIWDRIYRFTSKSFIRIKEQRVLSKLSLDENKVQEEIDTYIGDANRLLAAFLELGADPDKLGHPYPFSYDWKVPFLTDRRAEKYFSKGSRAINIAIEKGIMWESQVDLLLQYTKLDQESLKAAERSKDPAMITKIEKLWDQQQN